MIKVSNISKQFKLYDSPSDRLKELVFRRSYHRVYKALKDISFTVPAGQTLGILGKNGAGKSTLLKIISGVLLADKGDIEVSGKITGLLELGTGFDKELSGLQNIVNNGLLIGMSRPEIAQQQQSIIDFSELGSYIKEPIRTYSSGMIMRLAFSVAMHAKPDCFLIDEALSVGDAHFQQKCMRYIKQFKEQGGSIIFVSHDLNAVKMICDQAIVLDQGAVVAQGAPEQAVNHYNRLMAKLDETQAPQAGINNALQERQNFGNQKASIIKSALIGVESKTSILSCGEKAELTLQIEAAENIDDLTIGVLIRDRFGQDIFGTNSHHLVGVLKIKEKAQCLATFEMLMSLGPGKYTVTLALHSQDNHIDNCYHWIDSDINFEVAGIIGPNFSGVCRLDTKLSVSPL
ncbi:MAG: ABC transporter ATP-binding protein [Cycloclasticus sp.]|jgi:lipopolysaccharide transport system ATP-binding protein|nr:ABC transporter ATP-binding protein [Gammaproteobacteria bacterium]